MNTRVQLYDWDTTHDQAKKTMTHHFLGDIECIVNWNRLSLTIRYKGRVVDVFSFERGTYTVEDHERTLLRISRIAYGRPFFRARKLKQLRHVFGL